MVIVWFDAIKSLQMLFGLVPKVFFHIHVISLVAEKSGRVDAHEIEASDVERIVCVEGLGEKMLSGVTLSSMIGSKVSVLALGTMAVKNTFPPCLSKLNTVTLPAAPLPRFPFRIPTK